VAEKIKRVRRTAEEARRVVSTMQKSRTVGVSENAQMDPEVRKEMQRVFGK